MTATTQSSQSIANIADRAMLVGLNIRQFSPVKTDKKVTAEVAQAHNVKGDMGAYKKSLIAKDRLAGIRKKAGEIRQEHYRRTLPWAEDGARILTSAGYWEYADWIRTQETAFWKEVQAFLADWSDIVHEAKARLGTLFNQSEYPDVDELKETFEFRWTVRPVPVADDFRVALGASEVSAIRAEMKASLDATVETAMRDVWTRMRDVVGKMAERLRAYDPNKPAEAPFRDSLVSNIVDLLDVLPTLNLTNDPAVTDFTRKIEKLVAHDAQTLRDNVFVREDTAKRAESIYNQMAAFIS